MSKHLAHAKRAARARQAALREPDLPVRRGRAAVVGTVLAVALVAGGISFAVRSDDGSPAAASSPATSDGPVPDPGPTTAAGRWRAAALADYKPVNAIVVPMIQSLDGWRAGTVKADRASAMLQRAEIAVRETRSALARRTALSQAPQALDDFRGAADLYLESIELAQLGTTLPRGELLTQLQLSATRLRTLGDRVFDQAGVELEPFDPRERDVEGVVVRKPAEVPDWEAVALGAGPPLDVTPSPAPIREHQKTRPQESIDAWRSHVAALGISSGTAEAQAISSGSSTSLRDLARSLATASDALHALPDPDDERPESTRVQLALLVHAEAARVAQLAVLLPRSSRPSLVTTAQSVAAIGDALWSNLLPLRKTGLTPRP